MSLIGSHLRVLVTAWNLKRRGYHDFRLCSKCGKNQTGYEFIAMCNGTSPDDCPNCGGVNTSKRPWPLPQIARVEATGEPMMRKLEGQELIEAWKVLGPD